MNKNISYDFDQIIISLMGLLVGSLMLYAQRNPDELYLLLWPLTVFILSGVSLLNGINRVKKSLRKQKKEK